MAKTKPSRKTSITNTIDELKKEHEKIVENSTTINLLKISEIHELKLNNDILMHNRISYSKSKLLELAENIYKLKKENAGIMGTGLLNPIMVRIKNGKYERIHGHNRINAIKLNGDNEVPAIVLENISDELARFMRSSENLNREDLNAYDETLSILEHIQLACNFDSIENVKSFINKIKNFQAGKSSLNDEEKILHKKVSDVFERIGRFDIITFVDRLSVLKLNELIKQALVDQVINYTQAKVIKSKLKDTADIKKILTVLENKKLSVNELKKLIEELINSKNPKSNEKNLLLTNITNLSKKINTAKYSKLELHEKKYVDDKLFQIEKLYNEILERIK